MQNFLWCIDKRELDTLALANQDGAATQLRRGAFAEE
jgi:hypothetical protein